MSFYEFTLMFIQPKKKKKNGAYNNKKKIEKTSTFYISR